MEILGFSLPRIQILFLVVLWSLEIFSFGKLILVIDFNFPPFSKCSKTNASLAFAASSSTAYVRPYRVFLFMNRLTAQVAPAGWTPKYFDFFTIFSENKTSNTNKTETFPTFPTSYIAFYKSQHLTFALYFALKTWKKRIHRWVKLPNPTTWSWSSKFWSGEAQD